MPDSAAAVRALRTAEALVKNLAEKGETAAAAESCTAGLAAHFIASVPGASRVLWGAFVTYTADAKTRMLGVPKDLIENSGPVSAPVAEAMARGALEKSGASWAFSVTGLAGPDGDGVNPVGTVWIAFAHRAGESRGIRSEAEKFFFTGSRNEVREAAALKALEELAVKTGARARRP